MEGHVCLFDLMPLGRTWEAQTINQRNWSRTTAKGKVDGTLKNETHQARAVTVKEARIALIMLIEKLAKFSSVQRSNILIIMAQDRNEQKNWLN